jgi:hypothetical protein
MKKMKKVALVMLPALIFLVLISVGYAVSISASVTVISGGDTTPPTITILSPQNATYYSNSTPLTFTINEPTSWIKYSLDNQPNVTITGNIPMNNLADGSHNVIVYASDTSGNVGYSNRIYFKNNVSVYLPWETSYIGQGGYPIIDIEAYNGKLYFVSNLNHMYIFNGNNWSMTQTPVTVPFLKSYGGKLYVAGSPGYVYSFDGSNWSSNPVLNMSGAYGTYISMLGNYSNRLYVGSYLDYPAKLYYCDGSCDNSSNWHLDTSFASILYCPVPFCSIDSMGVYNGKMYLAAGGTIYTYNSTWSVLKDNNDYSVMDMKVYNNKLYLATRDANSRCPMYAGYSGFCGRVIEYDGTNWRTVFDHIGSNYRDGYWMYSLEVYNNKLYAGTAERIYMYDETSWQLTFDSIQGAQYALVMKAWNSKIYVGFGDGVMFKDDFAVPPIVTILSPKNTTYSTSSISLTFTTNMPSSFYYSLDGQSNVTVTGNITLNLNEGTHNIIVYAKNSYGQVGYSKVYFTISIPKPDLIINDIQTSGNTISYSIKNQGNANAGSSYSYLYVDNSYKTYDYLSSLTAGSSASRTFSYAWSCSGTSDSIKVCADANSNVVESNENNNCLTKTFTCPTPPPVSTCTCTAWEPIFDCCYFGRFATPKERWIRTCNPAGCQTESKCEGYCFL